MTCTFVNTKRGSITIIKDVEPGQDATDFSFTHTIDDDCVIPDLDDDNDGTLDDRVTCDNVAPGSYTVSEVNPTPFTLIGIDCVDPDDGSDADLGSLTAIIDLDPGEDIVCTFTNIPPPPPDTGTIVIIKQTVPSPSAGIFLFSDDIPDNCVVGPLADNGAAVPSDTVVCTGVPIQALPYTVTETDPTPGYDLTSVSCATTLPAGDTTSTSLANRQASIDLDANETVTCTFVNTQRGSITIIKDVNPEPDETNFAFTDSIDDLATPGDDCVIGSLDDDGDGALPNFVTCTNVKPGIYTVSENDPAPYSLSGLDCVDPDGGSSTSVATRTATIDLDPGQDITCTFTNVPPSPPGTGTVIIVKDTNPEPTSAGFSFIDSIVDCDIGILGDDGGGPLPNSATCSGVPIGSYTVTESDPTPAFDLAGLACVTTIAAGDTTSTSVPTRTATIDLDAGETVTCTFTNVQRGSITIIKDTNPETTSPTFDFDSTLGDFDLANNGSETFSNLFAGSYGFTENESDGWSLAAINCNGDDVTVTLAAETVIIDLQVGENVTCTFVNVIDDEPGIDDGGDSPPPTLPPPPTSPPLVSEVAGVQDAPPAATTTTQQQQPPPLISEVLPSRFPATGRDALDPQVGDCPSP